MPILTHVTIRSLPFLLLLCLFGGLQADESRREAFSEAWQAAAKGDRSTFEQAMPGLRDYLLYPYLQYEDYRHRRARVPDAEMAAFLEQHEDWAFTAGLRKAWLRTLGSKDRWPSLLQYAGDASDTEIRCHVAHARIREGLTDGLLDDARELWAVGQSQPDACDPVFNWLRRQGGIDDGLAWERIKRAMEARHPRLTLYLARYLDASERVWAERWQQMDRTGYRRLDRASHWHDLPKSRDIAHYGLGRLARSDPDRAEQVWRQLESRFSWNEADRASILREMALWSAVEGLAATPDRMRAVPEGYRDDRLMEWWVRYDLSRANWAEVMRGIEAMSEDVRSDSRWRYWHARALLESGDREAAGQGLDQLATEANYYGFLAADSLGRPYAICPEEPSMSQEEIDALGATGGFQRALELRAAGIENWARAEWQGAVAGLDRDGLRRAAGLAYSRDWPDRAIFALGNSGDLRWYEWRFPLDYAPLAEPWATRYGLDPSWVLGLMRSESALAVDAISSANARGLMQVTPGTAKQLSRRHGIAYSGSAQLLQAEKNIEFGTAYLRDLLDRFDENAVLASGAYNAGPHVVDRWLDERKTSDPTIWVETLPYFETRDYIPRVLAFTTLYDWRRTGDAGGPVKRLSGRMPALDAAAPPPPQESAEVVCKGGPV